MDISNLDTICYDILYDYIWPSIPYKTKVLLNYKLYNKYHNICYKIDSKYLIFIIKNNIHIALPNIFNNIKFNINLNNKFKYDNKIFFNYYTFYLYLCKKHKNIKFYNYYIKNINNNLQDNIRIKEYKKYIDKNILWMK